MELFYAIHRRLGEKRIIAEDLGYMTDSVRALVRESGYPNMRVLEFAFNSKDSENAGDYLPYNYNKNCVVYTGTHDNETLYSWYENLDAADRQMLLDYIRKEDGEIEEICKEVIYLAMSSVANYCIIPIQDYLGYGNMARMNMPSTLGKNWRWRLKDGEIGEELLKEIHRITKLYGRCRK